MFKTLDFDSFKTIASEHKRIAVYKEISGDNLTPINAFLALREKYLDLTLLESNPKELHAGRFSHLCFNIDLEFKSFANSISITRNQKHETQTADPFLILRTLRQQHYCHNAHHLSNYVGGLVGFMSYDAIRLTENISDSHDNAHQIPDLLFRIYQSSLVFDHQTNTVAIIQLVERSHDLSQSYEQAMQLIDNIHQQLNQSTPVSPATLTNQNTDITVDIPDHDFMNLVEKAKLHITAGDAFQIVLSREFSLPISAEPFKIYRGLRLTNPSPYMFYIQADDYAIAGTSPEKLVTIKNNLLESCPLAGTRPRRNHDEYEVETELLNHPKDCAEHMMLVDLTRNDLGRIAKPGTVHVSKLKQIEKFAKVMHISSTVTAELDPQLDVFDALKATLPAGTLSGAPKISAMNIIDELEVSRHGIYGGAIVAIDCNNDLMSCIAIRTTFIKDNIATVRAGAGIVFDSDPQAEADETRHKAQAVLQGIKLGDSL